MSGVKTFLMDRTHHGKPFRFLHVIDEFTLECLAIRVERKLNARIVLEVLSDLFLQNGPLQHIRSEYGLEFIATALREWLTRLSAIFIEPGIPRENDCCVIFKSKIRDEMLARVYY